MKQFLCSALLILAIGWRCSAGSCETLTLAGYISLGTGGCTIGTNTLFGFQVLSGASGAVPISPAAITIVPSGGTLDPALSAITTLTASAGTLREALFTYKISGNPYIRDSIALTNSSASGDGAVTDVQNFCAGGTFGSDGITGCSGKAGSLLALSGVQNRDSAKLGPASLLNVTDDFTLDGGLSGAASGGKITDQFAAAPEPSGLLLTGMALFFALSLKLRSSGASWLKKQGGKL
ncbi:MAG: hypothetical protein JOY54_15110 [Acidobacteriaceae bacterium]|nr:hypothetical protein [Acidobacteriaceae bacterium]